MRRRLALALALACGAACGPAPGGAPAAEGAAAKDPTPAPTPVDPAVEAAEAEAKRRRESAHHVVFADRISQGYALLLADEGATPPTAPTREELRRVVEAAFAGDLDDPEVARLLSMVMQAPLAAGEGAPVALTGGEAAGDDTDGAVYQRARELLGLHVEVAPVEGLVDRRTFDDPALTRELDPAERASLAGRRWALVLRADYRNQHGVRGLRLLQTLVRLMAERDGALIHDPDTQETMGPARFAARRLQAGLGNVADQVAVVPFADPRHGAGFVRLATRGMRRFGSVDLELDGLPADPAALQRATFLLHGLARVMVKLGEADASGLAVEAPAEISIVYRDCDLAYAGRGAQIPRCARCPEEVVVHLVERPAEPQDPVHHVMARVVAPRTQSDAASYDHPAWVRGALERVFGGPGDLAAP